MLLVKNGSLRFADFKRVWKETNFSMIHLGKPQDMVHREYIQSLFATTLGKH